MTDLVGQPQMVQVPNYSGVNIQIINPTVMPPGTTPTVAPQAPNVVNNNYSTNPIYPPNYYTQNLAQQPQPAPVAQTTTQTQATAEQEKETPKSVLPETKPSEEKDKKIEKPKVQLTDDYIQNLEQNLSSQNQNERLAGAKEIYQILEEDDSKKGDPALNALINKMLQDPYQPVKFIAINLIDQQMATGNENTAKHLQKIQQRKTADQQDELIASSALLKLSQVRSNQ